MMTKLTTHTRLHLKLMTSTLLIALLSGCAHSPGPHQDGHHGDKKAGDHHTEHHGDHSGHHHTKHHGDKPHYCKHHDRKHAHKKSKPTEAVTDETATEAPSAKATTTAPTQESTPDQHATAAATKASAALMITAKYSCQQGLAERIIRVVENPSESVACEVTYEKSSGTQTLWSAGHNKQYCHDRALEFTQKQVGWGWQCKDRDDNEIQ